MATARVAHTATLLPNGKVLVAGGSGISFYLASAELYDPATGTWSTTGSMATARRYHTATLLPNGKVLVTGGYNGSYLASSELYDPATGTWSTTGSMATTRQSQTATLLPNGKVLVTGGYNDIAYLAGTELYDPATGTWTTTGSMATAHYYHTATLLPNGTALVTGGANDSGYLNSAELYNVGFGFTPPINPIFLTTPVNLAYGSAQFGFTNSSDLLFRVLASTNPLLSPANWSVLGYPAETTSGQYLFTDTQAPNYPQRFYRVTIP
jgi:WD40 repeat protein